MEIFLVQARVERSEYMGSSHEFDDIRLVKAESAEQAEHKFKAYWEGKSTSYGTTYYVLSCDVVETIS